jgi:hypothetical protein
MLASPACDFYHRFTSINDGLFNSWEGYTAYAAMHGSKNDKDGLLTVFSDSDFTRLRKIATSTNC